MELVLPEEEEEVQGGVEEAEDLDWDLEEIVYVPSAGQSFLTQEVLPVTRSPAPIVGQE